MNRAVLSIGLSILTLSVAACEADVIQPQGLVVEPMQETLVATEDGTEEAVAAPAEETLPTAAGDAKDLTYVIVDTGQDHCYSDSAGIPCPSESEAFFGQDAQYLGRQASYVDNGDGTVTDLNTGLMWQQTPDLANNSTFEEALAGAESFDLGGYTDWRLPTIKELYSLVDFNGSVTRGIPYIDTVFFDFRYGDVGLGEREIDAQYWSSTAYVGTTMRGNATVFGVNFADGRIKGYPEVDPRGAQGGRFVRYVRGSSEYGINDFVDNGDGTITDRATGLMWHASDSARTLNWEEALDYCASLEYAGFGDWRLPNAKELQSIVDYSRSPQTSGTAAIDPIFEVTETESWYWTSTTHLDSGPRNAVYFAFGQAFGLPNGNLIDVHGAGAQRSDPKAGDPAQYAAGRGTPGQDDQVRIYNYARCVREGVYGEMITDGEVDALEGVGIPPNGGQGEPGRGQPPQEAIEACVGLASDADCTINTPAGQLSGNCTLVPTGQLACVPSG